MQTTTQARADKKARISELRRKLAGLTPEERQAFTDRGIIATVEGRTLSLHNTFMVYLQCNGQTPSVVGGYQQWKRAGRQVMKGQHGYTILFPAGQRDKETGDIIDVTRFYAGTVFDIAQTEPIDTPEVKETSAPALAKGDTGRADYRISGIKQPMPAPEPVNKMKDWAIV